MTIERTYRATLEEMWDLWTTKEGFESWWGPEGFRVEVNALEARQGGALHYEMIADTPEMIAAMKQMGQAPSHPTRSRFTEFVPHRRLVITSAIDFLPGVETYDNTFAVEFEPAGEHVKMIVTLSPMHSADFSKMQQMGFTSQLKKLARILPEA